MRATAVPGAQGLRAAGRARADLGVAGRPVAAGTRRAGGVPEGVAAGTRRARRAAGRADGQGALIRR